MYAYDKDKEDVMATTTRRRKTPPTRPVIIGDRAKIVVRFRDLGQFTDDACAKKWIGGSIKGELASLEKRFGAFSIEPLLAPAQLKLADKLVSRAIEQDKGYRLANFRCFYVIEFKGSRKLVAPVKTLFKWESVESAYIDKAGPDPVVDASDDPRAPNQGYLDPAPDGIDAEYAWGFTGGDGAGQRFIDLERGWTLDHEDLNDHGGTLLHGTLRDSSRAHGTSVNNRNVRPSLSWSCIKSIDQILFATSGTASGTGFSRCIRRLGFIRKFSANSQ